jgi:protein-S-isoprenylcysteine O-methyltransferase Ste14
VSPAFVILGAACFCVGLELLRRTTSLFHWSHGSLAPWNPPAQMVIEGPYRYTRNPMITGIFAMLLGEALALRSRAIAGWLCLFAIAQNVYIRLDGQYQDEEQWVDA